MGWTGVTRSRSLLTHQFEAYKPPWPRPRPARPSSPPVPSLMVHHKRKRYATVFGFPPKTTPVDLSGQRSKSALGPRCRHTRARIDRGGLANFERARARADVWASRRDVTARVGAGTTFFFFHVKKRPRIGRGGRGSLQRRHRVPSLRRAAAWCWRLAGSATEGGAAGVVCRQADVAREPRCRGRPNPPRCVGGHRSESLSPDARVSDRRAERGQPPLGRLNARTDRPLETHLVRPGVPAQPVRATRPRPVRPAGSGPARWRCARFASTKSRRICSYESCRSRAWCVTRPCVRVRVHAR